MVSFQQCQHQTDQPMLKLNTLQVLIKPLYTGNGWNHSLCIDWTSLNGIRFTDYLAIQIQCILIRISLKWAVRSSQSCMDCVLWDSPCGPFCRLMPKTIHRYSKRLKFVSQNQRFRAKHSKSKCGKTTHASISRQASLRLV